MSSSSNTIIDKMRGFACIEPSGRFKDARQRAVILERHLRDEPLSLAEMGEQFGVCRERVRQIEVEALKNLKKALLMMEKAA